MKYLSVGIAVAAAAAAWAWWLHERGHETQAVTPPVRGVDSAAGAGIDDAAVRAPPNPDPASVRTPPDPDPASVRTPPNPDPAMVFKPGTGAQRSAANSGRKA